MPPTPHYVLSWSNTGALGNAMREVAYERTVGDADDVEDCFVARVVAQHSLRTWLSELGGRDTARACSFTCKLKVVWTGRWSLRQIVRQQQAEVRRRFAAMARELERRHLVRGEETRRLSAIFDLDLFDGRGDQRPPLPEKEWLLGNG
jgi:hypothetical protein